MRSKFLLLVGLLLALPLSLSGQSSPVQDLSSQPTQPIPSDREQDSYSIYSMLLPLGETRSWEATFFAVRDSTIAALPLDAPCYVVPPRSAMDRTRAGGMNPHAAIIPPTDRQQDYKEMLDDFDKQCHDRFVLDGEKWKATKPVHLLKESEQNEFQTARDSDPALARKYEGTPALYGFSEVYFNAHHDVAMVYATHWCGGLCGEGFWVILEKRNGRWTSLPWQTVRWIS